MWQKAAMILLSPINMVGMGELACCKAIQSLHPQKLGQALS